VKRCKKPPAELLKLICSASNIESLTLEFEEEFGPSFKFWLPTELFSLLCEHHFPNLRYLRIVSRFLVPLDVPKARGLRQFLRNHQLETIILDASSISFAPELTLMRGLLMSPKDIASLMPSIRHFEGPCVMFEALLRSKLAGQIEKLGLIESTSELGDCKEVLSNLGRLTSTELSRLKKLELCVSSIPWEDMLTGLAEFVEKTPMLEELVISDNQENEPSFDSLVGVHSGGLNTTC
jgi:hypothetical protein